MSARRAGIIALAVLLLASGARAAETTAPHEPESYRNDDYRSPTPATLRGARVVSTAEAHAIWKEGAAAFVDVLPRPAPAPALPAGTLWRGQHRYDIPGSAWLPDTGYGELSPAAEAYLKLGLQRVTGGNHAKPVVIYCQRNCWMSWNAAKRAVAWGYSAVVWYPEGTDGWQDAGLPLQEAEPAPPPGE